jgi:hypothetical protein
VEELKNSSELNNALKKLLKILLNIYLLEEYVYS